jgi:hypothetical protein
MLPSVDRAGRYYPLTFAALSQHGIAKASGEGWLDACEDAGRAALEQDTPPQVIADLVGSPELPEAPAGIVEATWWSEGSVRVTPSSLMLRYMPDAATYATMLGAKTESTDVASDASRHGGGTWESPS